DTVVAQRPQAHAVVFPHGGALVELLADQRIGEQLALVHGMLRTRLVRVGAGRVRTVLAMDAFTAIGDPRRQRRLAHRLAGGDVLVDPAGNLLPAGGLPGLERTELPAVAPADREIH